MKPYYQDKWVTIYHGDCREILPQLDVKVDLVLTDPPYGIGKEEWDVSYPDWLEDWAFAIAPTVCVLTAQWCLPQCLKQMGNRYKWMIAGFKPEAMTRGRLGLNKWLPAVVGGEVVNRGADAKVFHVMTSDDGNTGHSCQKPAEYVLWLISQLSRQDDIILDPFLGSGTTCYCAKKLNRYSIGIEIEEYEKGKR